MRDEIVSTEPLPSAAAGLLEVKTNVCSDSQLRRLFPYTLLVEYNEQPVVGFRLPSLSFAFPHLPQPGTSGKTGEERCSCSMHYRCEVPVIEGA